MNYVTTPSESSVVSVSLMDDNEDHDSDSLSSSSGEERDLTQTMFKQQVKFFCQMKDFLMSQQMSLRHQLEALNSKLTKKKTKKTHTRRQRMPVPNSSSIQIPAAPSSTDDLPNHNDHNENIQQFFSCSSTDKSEDFQMCPLCGLELENPGNPEALEEHVAGHWCPPETL